MKPRRLAVAYLGVLFIFSAALILLRAADGRTPVLLRAPLETIETDIAGWTMRQSAQLEGRSLQLLRPTSYLARTYHSGRFDLGLFIAYYAVQRAGEALHSPKNCLPGAGWTIISQDSVPVPFRNTSADINRFVIQKVGQRSTTLYWYQSSNRIIASEYLGKAMLFRDALFEGRTDGSLVRIIVPCNPEAERTALLFAASVIRQLDQRFGAPAAAPAPQKLLQNAAWSAQSIQTMYSVASNRLKFR